MAEQKPLKILMMGGRRCGKTSALASLFEQMVNGPVKNYFTVSDQTILETKDGETQDSLNGKFLELTQMLGKPHTKTFLVDKGPTNNFWNYSLKLQIPGTDRAMFMEFRDSAGEFFEAGGAHSKETNDYVSECDVFVIIVDTPYLMGCNEEESKELCTEAINLGTNRINDIHGFLTNINDNDGQDAKMVVFVPLKCEKWVKDGRIDEVTARIKTVYEKTIKALSAYKKMTVGIIPIETAGKILFSEFKDAYTITGKIGGTKRCCKISETIVRLEDGTPKKIKESDIINEDDKAVISGTSLMRPYAWYNINPNDPSYAPKNCEQLPLHILHFMFGKYKEIETKKEKGGFLSFLKGLWDRICAVFGKIKIDELDKILTKMRTDGIIKNSGDGIEYIQKCY